MGLSNFINKVTGSVDKFMGYNRNIPDPYDFSAKNSGEKFNYQSYFLSLFNNWEFAIPNNFMFIVYIDPFPAAINARDFIVYEGSDGSNAANNIDTAVSKLTDPQYQATDAGCVFANGLSLPQESFGITHATLPAMHTRGYIPGVLSEGRANFNPLILNFRETNLSFVHCVIRPWVIMASHFGLVARPPGDKKNIKSNIMIIQLGKNGPGAKLLNRKIYRFYDAVPYNIPAYDLDYQPAATADINVEWAFSKYNIETLPETEVNIVLEDAEKSPFVSFLDKVTGGKASKINGKLDKFTGAIQGIDRTAGRAKRALGGIGI